jgi:hypothetical protein
MTKDRQRNGLFLGDPSSEKIRKELGSKALVKKANVGRSTKRKPSEEEQVWEFLGRQKESALASVVVLSELMPAVAAEGVAAHDLHHHATGFYEEVDKLAKGKAMLEVTDRTLEEVNSIIADTKRLIIDDPFLKRTHEFVPAGNNPVYPDVLLALKSVLQSLQRFRKRKLEEHTAYSGILSELNTILVAIDLRLEGEETATKEQLAQILDQPPNPKWIVSFGYNDSHFNFQKLASVGPPIVEGTKKAQLTLGSGE